MYAKAGTAAMCYTIGMTQFIDCTVNVFSLSNLAILIRNLGKKGGKLIHFVDKIMLKVLVIWELFQVMLLVLQLLRKKLENK
ncbi:MAG TPA: hypothetical protein EYH54_04900 [Nautiliaceae bacterium]|nr:hypothetical protein [Nautiliaceae bacterium]